MGARVAGPGDRPSLVRVPKDVHARKDRHARSSPAPPPVRIRREELERRFRMAAVVDDVEFRKPRRGHQRLHEDRSVREDLVIPGRRQVLKLCAGRDPGIFKNNRGISLVQDPDEEIRNAHKHHDRLRAEREHERFPAHELRVAPRWHRNQGVPAALDPFVEVRREDPMHSGQIAGRGRKGHVDDAAAGDVPGGLRLRNPDARPEPIAVGLLEVAEIRELRADSQDGAILHAVQVKLGVDQIGDARHQQGRDDGREGQELEVLYREPICGPRVPQKRFVGPEDARCRGALVPEPLERERAARWDHDAIVIAGSDQDRVLSLRCVHRGLDLAKGAVDVPPLPRRVVAVRGNPNQGGGLVERACGLILHKSQQGADHVRQLARCRRGGKEALDGLDQHGFSTHFDHSLEVQRVALLAANSA